jgi:hypothetical protein
MISQIAVDFGYCPEALSLNSHLISVSALPNLKETVDKISASRQVEADWIYAGTRFRFAQNALFSPQSGGWSRPHQFPHLVTIIFLGHAIDGDGGWLC